MGYVKDRWIAAMQPTPNDWGRRWIPVSERLPEDGQPSLACWGQRSTRMGIAMIRRSGGKAAWFHKYDIDDDDWGIAMEAPTHWMPLPEPPSDDK